VGKTPRSGQHTEDRFRVASDAEFVYAVDSTKCRWVEAKITAPSLGTEGAGGVSGATGYRGSLRSQWPILCVEREYQERCGEEITVLDSCGMLQYQARTTELKDLTKGS